MTLLIALRAIASSEAPCHSGGYSMAPTPMIAPWPFIRRGTEWLVPMVPGLVRLIVVPWKSETSSLLLRAFLTISSYAVQKWAKSIDSAALMLGTSSWRVPSGLGRSIARPRLMCAGVTSVGLPSTTSKPTFISGIDRSALTSAKPMMCVKDTLPPRARARWLLMTIRLSQSSLTGTCRTLVAVGTARLASMLATVRAGAPRSTVNVGSSDTCGALGSAGSLGTGRDAVGWVGAGAEERADASPVAAGVGAADGFATGVGAGLGASLAA